MGEKVKRFFKKYGIYAYTGIILAIAVVVLLIVSLLSVGKFDLKKITDKLDKVIDSSKDKLNDIKVEEVSLKIEKKVALEAIEKDRTLLVKKYTMAKAITDKKKRIDALIALNKSIEVKL